MIISEISIFQVNHIMLLLCSSEPISRNIACNCFEFDSKLKKISLSSGESTRRTCSIKKCFDRIYACFIIFLQFKTIDSHKLSFLLHAGKMHEVYVQRFLNVVKYYFRSCDINMSSALKILQIELGYSEIQSDTGTSVASSIKQ